MKGSTGTQLTSNTGTIRSALRARSQNRRLGRGPSNKYSGRKLDQRLNTWRHIDSGYDFEVRHVLMDYKSNEQLKSKMMTCRQASILNYGLSGSGFAWARCG